MTTNIWWIRRDLRLHDNLAFQHALADGAQILPVFVVDPKLIASDYVSEKRKAFLFDGLRSLDADLKARGSYLLVRKGSPLVVLSALIGEVAATRILAQADYSPYARARDKVIGENLPLTLTPGLVVHDPAAIAKADGKPYTVFTPYSRKWRTLELPRLAPPPPARIPTPPNVQGIELPRLVGRVRRPAGETAAAKTIWSFVQGTDAPLFRYAETRNQLDVEGTSGLSPYLRFGMVSARQAVDAAAEAWRRAPDATAVNGVEAWLNELIWRDFFNSILFHYPYVREHSFRAAFRHIRWANDVDDFDAWCHGRTGYPLVDAAMRQLMLTGWMHNRARMVVASFLTKDLLIDWRWGERWFMQQLLDGDRAANNGGWQWAAGTGTDAAPYFRIFNPISQSKQHDPTGHYIRQYVPELREVPDRYIHEPWLMPDDVQARSKCVVGEAYPPPIVDHGWARERTLNAYKQAKEQESQ